VDPVGLFPVCKCCLDPLSDLEAEEVVGLDYERILKACRRSTVDHRRPERLLIEAGRPKLERLVTIGVRIQHQARHPLRLGCGTKFLEDLLCCVHEDLGGCKTLLPIDDGSGLDLG